MAAPHHCTFGLRRICFARQLFGKLGIVRKLRKNIHKKLQRAVYDYLLEKQNDCGSLTLRERQFLEEYGLLLKAYGKDAVILRENKSKPRKKKAALGSSKDSE